MIRETRGIVPEAVEVFRAQESTDGDREADVEGGPIHVSSSSIHSRNDYIQKLEGAAKAYCCVRSVVIGR